MVLSCSAYGCTNRFKKDQNISFHSFPKDINILNKWLVAMGRDNFNPGKFARLCSKHFCHDDFVINFGRKTLKIGSVPSVFTISKPDTKRSQRTNINSMTEQTTANSIQMIEETSSPTTSTYEIIRDNIMESRSRNISSLHKRRRDVPVYMGDIKTEDLEDPKKVKQMWKVANKTISKQRMTINNLRLKLHRYHKKIITLLDLINHLKND